MIGPSCGGRASATTSLVDGLMSHDWHVHELRDEDEALDLDGYAVELRRTARLSWTVYMDGEPVGTLVEVPSSAAQRMRSYVASSATEQRLDAHWPEALRWMLKLA